MRPFSPRPDGPSFAPGRAAVLALCAMGLCTMGCIDTSGLVFDRDGPGSGGTGGGGGSSTSSAMPGAAYQERVLADGPLAYWPLDDVENASRTPDVSGNGHDANLDDANGSGSIAFDAAGAAGTTGASLDNRGSIFVGLPNPLGFGSGSYTLEAWIRLDEGDGADLLSANDPGGPGYATFYDTMFTAVTHKRYDGSGGFETMDQQGILLDTLRHIAIVFDAALGEGQIYVDGEPTQLPPFPLTLSWTTSSTFVLGRAANDSTITLDEVAVYDRVLDAEEVAAHFDCADGCSE